MNIRKLELWWNIGNKLDKLSGERNFALGVKLILLNFVHWLAYVFYAIYIRDEKSSSFAKD